MSGNDVFFGWFLGLISAVVIIIISYEPRKEFKSEEKLVPSYELVIKDNKVDTLYVYKIK